MYILEDKILSIPEKIRAIRKFLGLKQEDLTNGNISRSLISYIENGKVELTKDTAGIISSCIKKILSERKIPFNIDADYITSDERSQAEILLERYLNELRKFDNVEDEDGFLQQIGKIEKILSKWNLPQKKQVAYELIGDSYYERAEFDESYIYYIKALENSVESNKFDNYVKILSKIGRCCIRMDKYSDAIKYNDDALAILNINSINDDDILYLRCLFNNALAYEYLGYYDKSLDCLERLKKSESMFSPEQCIDILIVEGRCYCYKGDLEIAENAYQDALKIARKNNMSFYISMVLTNTSALYEEKDDIQKAIYYDKEALKIKENIKDERIAQTLVELGKKYKVLKQYDLAEKYLLRAVQEININKDIKIYSQISLELLDIYIFTSEHYLVLKLIDQIKEVYKEQFKIKNGQEIEDVETFLLTATRHLLETDVSQSKELLNLILERRREE